MSLKFRCKLQIFWQIKFKYYLAPDSGFKIQKEKYENAFQKKVPDFRKSKYVSTIVLL